MDVPNPYKKKNFHLPPLRNFGAGPVNCSVETLNAMLFQPITPINEHFYAMLDEIQEMCRYLLQTRNKFTIVSQTSGNGGNEMVVNNLADPGDTVIVASAGTFGEKVVDMGRRYGLNVIHMSKHPGEVYSLAELEEAIVKHKARVLFATCGASSGGTLQPLEGLGTICHKYDCLLAVDAIITLGVAPFFMDRWEIDAATGGSQKGPGAPAGLCIVSFSERAHKRILAKKHPVPYVHDAIGLSKVWNCFGERGPKTFHYTYGSPQLAALRQSLSEICEEGLEDIWSRHKTCSELFLSKVMLMGFQPFVVNPANRFYGINIIRLPDDLKYPAVVERLKQKHLIEIGTGLGPSGDKEQRNLRIGFLAKNAQIEYVDDVCDALKETIDYIRRYEKKG